MNFKEPLNTLKSKKYPKEKLDYSLPMLVSMKAFQSSYNKTKAFYKPISKIV